MTEIEQIAQRLNLDFRQVLKLLETINPGEYARIWRNHFDMDVAIKEWDRMLPLHSRLDRLAMRLTDEGRYTDADIVWFALGELRK